MNFETRPYRHLLIDSTRESGRRVEDYLKSSVDAGEMELVPSSRDYEDEQGMDCEATFRDQKTGAYLRYARHIDSENLVMVMWDRDNFENSWKSLRVRLRRGLGDLLSLES